MTVCIGCLCNVADNPMVIMAGDRMITSSEHLSIEFEHPKSKLMWVTDNCVIATAGNALIHTELVNHVRNEVFEIKHPSIEQIVSCIQRTYVGLRRRQIELEILQPRGIDNFGMFFNLHQTLLPEIVTTIQNQIDNYDYGIDILVGGVDYSGAHIYWIGHPGIFVSFDSLGYASIGSGQQHALSTYITSCYDSNCSLIKALYTTYKAKKLSERAPGVGSEYTDLWVVSSDGCKEVNEVIIDQLDEYYYQQLDMEKEFEESFDLGFQQGEEESEEIDDQE